VNLAETADGAALRLEAGERRPVSRWIYALVVPFPSLEDGTSIAELQRRWREGGGALWLDESTLAVFSKLWGSPGQGAVNVAPAGELVERAWESRAWALVPFEALEPRWKVLEVDGLSPIRKGFDPATYPLAAPISLDGEPDQVGSFLVQYGPESATPFLPATNRDPGRLTTLVLTGVTALVRATAYTMEQEGVKYPGRDIGDWLREADLAHISNEVPFAQNCPSPNPVQEDMRFCSDPRYIALLEDVGADIIELTGDHFQDWGREAMLYTLDMYRERGWPTYGGGANLDEGRQPALVEHNGNRLAFIGCNGKGGSYAQAGPRQPGAVACNDGAWMAEEIGRLRDAGYLPIATFQHYEYYTYQAQPDQKRDFRQAAEAGAVIVSGSQAHQPQAMEFDGGSFIHYGLGNLFFDQYDVSEATRQGFIDRHVFYNGRYISTELLAIQFVDYARPR
jgi:poly-gamma-glutamate synthesis protein (capsule biosynthesis protein)